MPNESQHHTPPPSLFDYYATEVANFHLSPGDGNDTTRSGRAAEAAQQASPNAVGQAISAAGTAFGVFGEVMSFTHQISEAALIPLYAQLSFMQGLACLPASSHLDPVVGIDVHLVLIPPSPSPVPMPHPYIAMVMDPRDWLSCALMSVFAMAAPTPTEVPAGASEEEIQDAANTDAAASLAFAAGTMALGMAGLGATVKLGGFTPRTVSGVKNRPIPHFPLGASFAPNPIFKNSGHVQFGSLFLVADGNPFTGMMHPNNDCWDMGILQLMRREYPTEPGYLFNPTGFVMAIPSHNVLVNPIPTPINPIAALTRMLNAGFAKLLHGITRRLPIGRRLRAALHKAICFVTGHPVDVVSGMLFTDEEDFSLPGVIPFSWERTWYSDSIHTGPLGHGWHHSYDIGFEINENNEGIFIMNDGRAAVFDLPLPGQFTFNRTEKLFLHCHPEEKFYYIVDKDGLIYRFTDRIYRNEQVQTECQLLQSIANANGYAIRFAYNRTGNLTKIIDSAGRELTVQNDYAGRITAILAPHPEEEDKTFVIAKYEYDEAGNLICHTDALGQKMSYEYQHHLLTKETWRNGHQWYFVYDGNQSGARCIHTWGDGDLYNHKLTYKEGCTLVENSLGHLTTYYHKDGLVYSKIDGNGAEWQYRHNQYHDLEWETDPLGNQHAYAHDEWGNLAITTDPAGGFTHTEYYNPQFPFLHTEAMDAAGGKWKWAYDDRGNLTEATNPLGAKTLFIYNDGVLTEIISTSGAITKFVYDKSQNITNKITENGAITQYQYDILGNCTGVINPNYQIQKRHIDAKGRIIQIHNFDGNDIAFKYDELDNVVRYKDNQKDVKYTYRGLWRITSRTEAGATIYFNYDTEEQLRNIVNEHGLLYKFELDALGNVLQEIGFDDTAHFYERNAAGWITQVLNPSGKITKYHYDACGRVTEVLYHNEKKKIYSYRSDGKLIQAINETAKIKFKRDVLGNILRETVNGEWIASEYDNVGNRVRTSSSLGANLFNQYNKMGNVLQMEGCGWQAKFKHDNLGFEVERILPGGINIHWKRDGISRPLTQRIGISIGKDFHTHYIKQYQWDVNNRLKQVKNEKEVIKFEYDAWSNLIKTIYPSDKIHWRNPDAVGNLYKTIDRKDRIYAKGGQLKKSYGYEYKYDADGNLIEKKHIGGNTWRYEWNYDGTLIKVIKPDKSEVSFTYDALGRRLSKRYRKTITKFIWDGNVPLHEWKQHALTGENLNEINVGEACITTWIFDPNTFAPCAKIKGGKQYSIVTDHLGTPTKMYKEDGHILWDCELDESGKVHLKKGEINICPFRFQGQYEDIETGLYYNRNRYYSVEEGTYISKDPIKLNGGLGLYNYVKDPNRYIDPFGLNFVDLAAERQRRNLPPAGSDNDVSTVARLEVGGGTYYGVNSGDQNPRTNMTLDRVNAQTITHAEAEAVQHAVNAGRRGSARTAEMWVDRDPCGACGRRGGFRSLARNLGVDALIVHTPSGSDTYRPTS